MSTAKSILKLLNTVGEKALFCTTGILDPVLPGLQVERGGGVGLPVSPEVAKQLITHAEQAPYGKGEETLLDTSVRNVWQLSPEKFSLTNPGWQTCLQGIVDQVKEALGVKKAVSAELYKLLIYEKGSFFKPHRDSEKQDGMFATLVVCLPSYHKGGTLSVEHDGKTMHFDFGGEPSAFQMQYIAFYTDCRHEIVPVEEGYRICLVYNLSLAKGKTQPAAPVMSEQAEKAAKMLETLFKEEERDKIAIPLKHEYTEAGLSPHALKGGDRARLEVLSRAAEQLGYDVHLALLEIRQSGDMDYNSGGYYGWGEPIDEDIVEIGEIYDEYWSLNHWMDTDGNKKEFGALNLQENEVLVDDPEGIPFVQSVHEASGNAGVSVERWYRQTVVVLWPRDRYFRILAREGQRAAIPGLRDLIKKSKNPSEDNDCKTFAKAILDNWQFTRFHHGYRNNENSYGPEMLKLLEKLADADLVQLYLQQVMPKDYNGKEGTLLCKLAKTHGWSTFKNALVSFVIAQSPEADSVSLVDTAKIGSSLCSSGSGKLTKERAAVCRAVAGELEALIGRWDAHKPKQVWIKQESRAGVIEAVAPMAAALEEPGMLDRLLDRAFKDSEHYDIHKILIPSARSLAKTNIPKSPVAKVFERLRDHCIAELETLTKEEPQPPTDWKQNIKIKCTCGHCKAMQNFLHDPNEKVYRHKANENDRYHVENSARQSGAALTFKTEKTSRPYILVCTKTWAIYEKLKKQYDENMKLLTDIRGKSNAVRKSK